MDCRRWKEGVVRAQKGTSIQGPSFDILAAPGSIADFVKNCNEYLADTVRLIRDIHNCLVLGVEPKARAQLSEAYEARGNPYHSGVRRRSSMLPWGAIEGKLKEKCAKMQELNGVILGVEGSGR
ncbi:hypothetical protein ACLB2K_046516 [Fragaria x ananassa]